MGAPIFVLIYADKDILLRHTSLELFDGGTMDQKSVIGAAGNNANRNNCEVAVLERYGKAAQEVEACLCPCCS